jgi:hypothetical protein
MSERQRLKGKDRKIQEKITKITVIQKFLASRQNIAIIREIPL